MKSRFLEFVCLMLDSYFAFETGGQAGEERGHALLKKAMTLGREADIVNFQGLKREVVTRLCAKALEAGIEVEFAKRLITSYRFLPEGALLDLEQWRWLIKVYTLGRFRIEKDGKPLLISGKVPRKPLEMLKLLIAYGGRDVSDERIAEALWPEADGDTAYQSYETTLHRLRKMIGGDSAIVRQDGSITLDPRYWWTDVWAFERMIENGASSTEPVLSVLEKAVGMYKGPFLDGDGDKQWLISMRERLRSKFLRAAGKVGHEYEESGQWDKAVECYRKAIEADSLAEEFYQHLMTCYQRLGRKAEALAVYNRCRDTLYKVFGLGPSSKTEEIYLLIRQK